jgi:hypothetical protein
MLRRLLSASAVAVAAAAGAGCGSAGSTGHSAPAVAGAKPTFVAGDLTAHVDNPWFPLPRGRTLRYRGEKDGTPGTDVFTVTGHTKTILGVRTTVVHDRVMTHGRVTEDTLDYYAQDRRGNVWYLGEDTKELDRHGRVTSREGTWRAGVHGARAGVFMPADPKVGQSYRQEYYKRHAEDHFRIASLRATVHVPAVSTHRAMRTSEWTPLEPGTLDAKYYTRGLGTVLEQTVKGGNERWALVSVTP